MILLQESRCIHDTTELVTVLFSTLRNFTEEKGALLAYLAYLKMRLTFAVYVKLFELKDVREGVLLRKCMRRKMLEQRKPTLIFMMKIGRKYQYPHSTFLFQKHAPRST